MKKPKAQKIMKNWRKNWANNENDEPIYSRNSKQRNENWILKCQETSDWKTKRLKSVFKCREMSVEELRQINKTTE